LIARLRLYIGIFGAFTYDRTEKQLRTPVVGVAIVAYT